MAGNGKVAGSEKNVEAKAQPRTTGTPPPPLAKFLPSPATVPAPFQASSPQQVTAFFEAVCLTASQTGGEGRVHGPGTGQALTRYPCHLLRTSPTAPPPPLSQREGTGSAGAVLTARGQCLTAGGRELGQ